MSTRPKKRRPYLPRIVGDKVMMPADLERLHKYMLDIERIDHISDESRRAADPLKEEAEHFYRCAACGRWVDCRDLSQVFDHEGPLPHPAKDWRQQNLIAR